MKKIYFASLIFIAIVSAAPSAKPVAEPEANPEADPFFFKTVYVPYPAYHGRIWKRDTDQKAKPTEDENSPLNFSLFEIIFARYKQNH